MEGSTKILSDLGWENRIASVNISSKYEIIPISFIGLSARSDTNTEFFRSCFSTSLEKSRDERSGAIEAPSTLFDIFSLDEATGQLYVKGMFIDFETTDSYSFEVKITDTGVPSLSAKSTVRITVEDINEKPVLDHKKCNVGYRQCLSILENSLSLIHI